MVLKGGKVLYIRPLRNSTVNHSGPRRDRLVGGRQVGVRGEVCTGEGVGVGTLFP